MSRKLPSSLEVVNAPEVPLSKIELHVHLDGAVRHETLWELSKSKNLPLPGNGSLEALKKAIFVQKPKDLMHFLSSFAFIVPAFSGDYDAIKRLAFEFCQDEARNGVIYAEARFSPHLMTNPKIPEVTPSKVIEAVLEGFDEGFKEFGVTVKGILCCIRGRSPEEGQDILRLCEVFRCRGIVGIDLAGEEGLSASDSQKKWESMDLDPWEILVFNEAKKLGINRTVHAGEAAPAKSVEQALDELHAQRIGHGYRVIENNELYQRCLKDRIHFETCPHSSILTGAVKVHNVFNHPIAQFANDNANFSINSDDPTITGSYINDEFDIVRSWGLSEVHLIRATFNAQKSAFIDDYEKRILRNELLKVYGINED